MSALHADELLTNPLPKNFCIRAGQEAQAKPKPAPPTCSNVVPAKAGTPSSASLGDGAPGPAL
eukprot:6294079-Pyramimonas_sp.AAC.1